MIYRVGYLSFIICIGLFALVAYACACVPPPPPQALDVFLTNEVGGTLTSEAGNPLKAE